MLKLYRTFIKNSQSDLMRLTLLGLLCGLAAGSVVLLFRLLIDTAQLWLLPGDGQENYEDLPSWAIFTLPLFGGILLGIIFHYLSPEKRQIGVVHTLEHLKYHGAKLPVYNAVVQFFGAAISIISGHSVGREGPSIHLGAATGSALASAFNLSPKTRRTLLACGVSAAIAASFNTPLAGVIFAMEVILIEYTVISMLPMIVAAIVATLLIHQVLGNETILKTPSFEVYSNIELLGVALNGILIGLIAVVFIQLLVVTSKRTKNIPIFWRLSSAGAFVGLAALIAPEIMGIGYDTVNGTFNNQFALATLLLILAMKVLATAVGLGLGLPGGLIGPTLFIGAVTGSAIGAIIHLAYPDAAIDPVVYAIIGMGAMMSATIQAPLAALVAIFELTHEPSIIVPGLMAIIFASLTSSELLKQPSIFLTLMRLREIKTPGKKLSDNTQLNATMDLIDKHFITLPHHCPSKQLANSLHDDIHWVLVEQDNEVIFAIQSAMLQAINFSQIEMIDMLALTSLGYAIQKTPSTSPLFDVAAQANSLKARTVFLVYDQSEPTEHPPLLGILQPKDVIDSLNN